MWSIKWSTTPCSTGLQNTLKSKFYICKRSRKNSSNPKLYIHFTTDSNHRVKRSVDLLNLTLNLFPIEYDKKTGVPKPILSKAKASEIALKALEENIIFNTIKTDENPVCIKLKDYVRDFWNYENSSYVAQKALSGKPITKVHCSHSLSEFNNQIAPLLEDSITIKEVTIPLLEKIQTILYNKGLSSAYIRNTMNSLKKPLREAARLEMIDLDVDKVTPVSVICNEKGILTDEEHNKLMEYLKTTYKPNTYERWKYLLIALAYQTGMRVTELSTLKADCFHLSEKDPTTTFITVKTSYNDYDKLKDTKTHKARTVTAPTTLCNEILDYSGWNPGGFIFGSIVKREVPINSTTIGEVFREALAAIGISEEERKDRNITMYSSRHFYNTAMVDAGLDKKDIQRTTGHSTDAMTNHYTHETEKGLLNQAKIRSKVIPLL